MNTKINILYARLSREDMESNGESGSITNQIELLTKYAENNDIAPILLIQDDGWSGTSWSRPGWQELMGYVERGEVSTILVKTLDRIGRDHLRVGLLLEQFQEQGIRLIAPGDNIDTAQGVDDFVPLRTLFAEWYARDTSRKIRAINNARTREGRHVTGAIPYGFLRDSGDSKTWKLDEEAAPIVRRIYQMTIDGKGITQIAAILSDERVLIPTAHWAKIGADNCRKHPNAAPYAWTAAMVSNILKREEYMGWAVLNKTVKETYKSKRKPNDPDNILIFKDAHPAIVDEECWNTVQRLRGTRRIPERIGGDPNPLTGIVYCSDCGHKMHHKQGRTGREKVHSEYVCSSYRHYSRSCTMHYIRTDALETLILQTVKTVAAYALENEAEFIERVREKSALQAEQSVKDNRRKLMKSRRRRDEISGLIKKLYEGYATDKIPEKYFTELLAGYNAEQTALETEIERLRSEIDTFNADSVRADKFIELAGRYTEFDELTPALLNNFIERIIVHEADKSSGRRVQDVEILFSFIGKFDLPADIVELPAEEKKTPKKPRTDKDREYDRRRYAKIKAARLAEQETQRLAILEGTRFAV